MSQALAARRSPPPRLPIGDFPVQGKNTGMRIRTRGHSVRKKGAPVALDFAAAAFFEGSATTNDSRITETISFEINLSSFSFVSLSCARARSSAAWRFDCTRDW